MLDYRIVKNVLKDHHTIENYIILFSIRNNENFFLNEEFTSYLDILKNKYDFLSQNNKLTLKGIEFLKKMETLEKLNFYSDLHSSLQNELEKLTGKKQKMLQGKYAFLPNERDLQVRLEKIIKKYKINNFERIKEVLINYLRRCVKEKFNYTQTVSYYIFKNEMSNFVVDYENFENVEEEKEEIQHPKDIKELF